MKTTISLLILFAIVLGGGYWYNQRSANEALKENTSSGTASSTAAATTTDTAPAVTSGSTGGSTGSAGTASGGSAGGTGSTGTPAGTYALAEVATHNTSGNCWAAISGSVYNLTTWINQHPGGAARILGICGKDGTQAFVGQHGNDQRAMDTLATFRIGALAS